MSIKIMDLVFDGGPNDTVARFIMLAIADHADDEGVAYPGVALLAEKTNQSDRNVIRVLKELELGGWLAVQKRSALVETTEGNRRRINRYYLNIQRLRGRAEATRAERLRRKGTNHSGDTVSYTPVFRAME